MLPTNLKIERLRRNLTQFDIADELGVNRSYVSLLETSREYPSEEVAKKLEDYFNKPISYLLKKID